MVTISIYNRGNYLNFKEYSTKTQAQNNNYKLGIYYLW